jgi:hypothetical protein
MTNTRIRQVSLSLSSVLALAALASCSGEASKAICGMAYDPNMGRVTDFANGAGKPGTALDGGGLMSNMDGGMSTLDGGTIIVRNDAGAGDAGVTQTKLAQTATLSAEARLGLQINAFLDTSTSLVKAAREMDMEMLTICRSMATDLGIPEAEITAPAGQNATKVACTRVAKEIDTSIKLNLPVNAKLTIIAEPARCEISASFTHSCIETCENREIMESEITCKPGKLSGSCSAQCMGECSGSCSAQCTGKCTGQCTGSCTGTCKGECTGTCSAKNAKGECIGTCDGTCKGTCDATCNGSCSATCQANCNGSCTGTCRGDCSVTYVAPKCEEIIVTKQVQECATSCETDARAKAECTPPSVLVDFNANITPAMEANLMKVVNTLKKNYPALQKVVFRAGTVIGGSAQAYYTQIQGFVSASADFGVQAGACLASAVTAVGQALAQFTVIAEVNVSFTASVSASGQASAM